MIAVRPGSGTPTGWVQFSIDGKPYGPPVHVPDGVVGIFPNSPPLTAGTHAVTAVYSGDDNFAGSSISFFLTVNQATPILSVSDAGGTYNGNPFPAMATPNSLEGLPVTLAYYVGNTANGPSAPYPPSLAGTYTVVASFAGSSDYTAAQSNPVTFTIRKSIPIANVSDPGGTYTGNPYLGTAMVTGVSGIPGSSLEGVTPTLAYFTASGNSLPSAPSAAGIYTVVASFAGSSDYTSAQSNPVTFVISKANLWVYANDMTKTYGQTVSFVGSEFTTNGLLNSDTITSVTLTSAGAVASAAVAGSPYPIVPSAAVGSGLGNYTINYSNGALTVTRAPLVVTASNAARVYGHPNPRFTGTITGIQNGDPITTTYTTVATPASPVGGYAITASLGDPAHKLPNYTVTIDNGTLAVTPAPLTVTADNKTKFYGQPNPVFTASYRGFVLGQDPSVLGGTLAFSTPATTTSPVGSYPITPGGLTSTNYAITFVSGTLLVTPALLTATGIDFTATVNVAQDFTVAQFTDSAANAQPGDYAVPIDFGDGTPLQAGTVTQPGGPGTPFFVDATHTYTQTGTFTVHVRIFKEFAEFGESFSTATVGAAGGAARASSLGSNLLLGQATGQGPTPTTAASAALATPVQRSAPEQSGLSHRADDLYWRRLGREEWISDPNGWASYELAWALEGPGSGI